jgi:radical SAM protein with 4Fe4S-binding SPASM domain
MISTYTTMEDARRYLGYENFGPYFGEMVKRALLTTLQGIERYGIKKPFTSSAPYFVIWNLTNKCNLRCKHCYEWKEDYDNELTLEEKKDVIDQLDKMKVASIALSGGDPVFSTDFVPVSARMSEKGIYHSLATNGTLLTPDMVKKIKDLRYGYVQVSVDGDRQTHNYFRGGDSYDRTMEGIDNLVKAGMTTSISTTLTVYNKDQIFDMIKLAKEKGVFSLNLYKLVVTGRATPDLDVSPEFKDQLYEKLVEWQLQDNTKARKEGTRPFLILSSDPQYVRKIWDVQQGKYEKDIEMTALHFGSLPRLERATMEALLGFIGGCAAGYKQLAIDYNGNINPCVFMPDIVIGNTRTDDISYVWENSPILNALRMPREDIPGCGSCDYTDICGGCRAVSHASHRDMRLPYSLLQCDTGCVLNK